MTDDADESSVDSRHGTAPHVELSYAAPGLAPTGHSQARRGARAVLKVGSILLGLIVLAALLMPSLGKAREPANRVKCASNLRQIGQEIQYYADAHDGRFPTGLDVLMTDGDLSANCAVCPSSGAEQARGPTTAAVAAAFRADPRHCSYVYVGAGLTSASATPRHVLAYEPPSNHAGHPAGDGGDGINVLWGNGTVQWLPAPQARRLMNELNVGHNPPR